MNASKITLYLSAYGLTHALVDASCIMLVLGGIDVRDTLLFYVLLYNLLAFGLQLPFGWINDKLHKPVATAMLGCVILSAGLMLFIHPVAATVLAGIGNALFHVGGGIISLNLKPGKASMPGVFVAPGGIGLFTGALIIKTHGYHPVFFVIMLIALGLVLLLLKSPPIDYSRNRKTETGNYLFLLILLFLITICIRSAVGLSVHFPWKSDTTLLIVLTASIALGKGAGGFLSDYFGWKTIAVGGLIIAAPLLMLGSQFPVAGITGMLLFNFTMPVTLVAISNSLPGRPGFSFGLTTFALVLGALPAFFPAKDYLSAKPAVLILVLVSAIMLYIGLRLYFRYKHVGVH